MGSVLPLLLAVVVQALGESGVGLGVEAPWAVPALGVLPYLAAAAARRAGVRGRFRLAERWTSVIRWSGGGMSKNPVNSAVIAGDLAYVTNAYKGDLIQALGLSGAKGTRISVGDVLGFLASGMSTSEVVAEYPSLTPDDVLACLGYAADREARTVTLPAA